MLEGIAFDRERLARRGGRRADRGDRHRGPARPPRGPVPPVARHRRRARARGARRRAPAVRPDARGDRRHSDVLDDEYYDVLAQSSWLESKVSEGGTALARVREQLAHARAELEGQPACGPHGVPLRRRVLRPPGARGAPATRRLHARPRPARRRDRGDGGLPPVRARLPRLRRRSRRARTSSSGRPAAPTCTAPTASTRCSTPSASPRASAPRCSSARSSRSGHRAPCARGAASPGAEQLCSGPGKLTQALAIELDLQRQRPRRRAGPLGRARAAGRTWRSSRARGSGSPRRRSCRGGSARSGRAACRARGRPRRRPRCAGAPREPTRGGQPAAGPSGGPTTWWNSITRPSGSAQNSWCQPLMAQRPMSL